jgi:indole-3-acetate monooxygenase
MAATDGATVLEKLRALHAGIARRSDEIEATRHLPSDIAESMVEAKAFKLCVPREIGGVQGTAIELVTAIEEMSQADSAAGWCLMISATSGVTAAYLAPEFAKEIHGDPRTVTGGIFAPRGKAVKDGDGYVVTGTWQWASGSSHCQWMKGGCIVYEDGKPRMLREGVPDVRTMYFPKHSIRLHDNWYASGLCGTGSCDMTVEALRVPEGHTLSMIADKPWCDGPLYRFPLFGLLAIGCAAVALGVARGAIEDIRELAGAKTPTLSRRTLAERTQTQADVAKAEAQVSSARAPGYTRSSAGAGTPPRAAMPFRWSGAARCGSHRPMRSTPACTRSTPATRSAAAPRSIVQARCSAASATCM